MKYTYCERIIWYAMSPAICRYLTEQHPEWDIRRLKKTAKHCFQKMVARTPNIGSLKENSHRMNLTGGIVWLSFYKATPEKMSDNCFHGLIMAAMSAPLVKTTYTINKDKMFTPKGIIQRKTKLECNNDASDSPFNWYAEVILGRNEQEHKVHFHHCGLCELGKQENLLHLIPYMCDADYLSYPWMGGTLYRTQTLASGGAYCDFYICKQGSRWDIEKQKEIKNNC